jgi:hypothetical protein
MKIFPIIALATLLPIASMVRAVAPVEVVWLFKDRALVRVGGNEYLLKAGETRGI